MAGPRLACKPARHDGSFQRRRTRKPVGRSRHASALSRKRSVHPPVHKWRPSHVDTFDPKPRSTYAGQVLPTANLATERRTGAAFPRRIASAGTAERHRRQRDLSARCHLRRRLCVIRSMYADVPNHELH